MFPKTDQVIVSGSMAVSAPGLALRELVGETRLLAWEPLDLVDPTAMNQAAF
jgi:hypothetical protein